MRYLPSRRTLTTLLAPFALGVLLFALVATVAYQLGAADARLAAREDIRVYRAIANGYAEHDAADDTTIADLTRERDALREDFDALEASFSE